MSSLPKTYKAAVLTGLGKALEIKELPMIEPQPGEILIKVNACGVCHSDHAVLNAASGPPQIQMVGHEMVGTIVKVTAGEKKRKEGDRVSEA